MYASIIAYIDVGIITRIILQMKSAAGHTYRPCLRDYLLPFYLSATVRDKIKETSVGRDRDYHWEITELPRVTDSHHVSYRVNIDCFFHIDPCFFDQSQRSDV